MGLLMKLRTVLSILAISILVVPLSAHPSNPIQDSNRAQAVALWEEVIKAKGGRGRLHAIKNLLIVSKVKVDARRQVDLMETRRLYVLPDRAWLQATTPALGFSIEARVSSIEDGICRVTVSPKHANVRSVSPCLLTEWGTHLMQDPIVYLLETQWLQPKLTGTRVEEISNKRVDVIEAEINGMRVDFYLDGKTRLPFKLVTNQANGVAQSTRHVVLTVKLEDYANVAGIQMPRKIIRESAARPSMVSRSIEQAEYSFDVEYKKSLFDEPA